MNAKAKINGHVKRLSRKDILQNYRKQSLLNATRYIVAAQGFDAVTMERVAERAGITKGAIYLYFDNKDEMILEALEETTAAMLEQIERVVQSEASPWEKLCQRVSGQVEALEQHKEMLRTILLFRWMLQNPGERKRWRRVLRHRQVYLERIKAILDDGVTQRIFPRMDTDAAAFYVNELAIGTAHRRMMGLSDASLEDDTAALIDFLSLLRIDKDRRDLS